MAFVPLEKLSRLHDGYQKAVTVGRHNLLLLQVDGNTYLIENRCPHMDVPLSQGVQVPGGLIRCRAHGIEFNLETGKALGPLANQLDSLKKFTLVYDGDQVGIEM
ncbi:nitrite reductase/ring-hydroxylating ferredoxin subunit [Alteromonadaceae bacterium 2753L.S.0a.02]|nr:nitrite reductase/ring-hydroxylating ferredoxin subunit [Alteromonadaceae bacterium 2753L.S.0a.02]